VTAPITHSNLNCNPSMYLSLLLDPSLIKKLGFVSLFKYRPSEMNYCTNMSYVVCNSWEKDIVGMVEEKHGKKKIHVSFECETLKADKAAEDHIKQFMPKLAGLDAVGTFFLSDLTAHWIFFESFISPSSKRQPLCGITRNMHHIQHLTVF